MAIRKWFISASISASKYVGEVLAETEEEAVGLGYKLPRAGVSLCHKCSSECEDAEIFEMFASPAVDEDG